MSIARRCRLLLVIVVGSIPGFVGTASASTWATALAPASKGQAAAQAQLAAPTGVAAVCTSATSKTIKVTWSAVARASSYATYRSTTSATSGFTLTASGVTGTTWTSGTLSSGTYWFQVAAAVGTYWASPNSAAPSSHTISLTGCT